MKMKFSEAWDWMSLHWEVLATGKHSIKMRNRCKFEDCFYVVADGFLYRSDGIGPGLNNHKKIHMNDRMIKGEWHKSKW